MCSNGCSVLGPQFKTSVEMGNHVLNFEIAGLEPEDKERAKKELRETPEVVREALETLRKLILNEPKLTIDTDDETLNIFLRPCKYYPHSALDKMKKFYRFKITHPKYYENLLPSCEKRAFIENLVTVLPSRNTNGERVLVVEAGKKWNPKKCTLNEILRSVMMILEAAMVEPRTQISGVHVILDMNGLSMQHVWQFTPSFAKHLTEWVQECIPIRLKGVHIVNQVYLFNMIYVLFKPLLGEKLQQRLHFHGSDMSSLHNYINPSVLPYHFGGKVDIPFDQGENFHSYLSTFEEKFVERSHFGYSDPKDCN